jgi:hypothetical protein
MTAGRERVVKLTKAQVSALEWFAPYRAGAIQKWRDRPSGVPSATCGGLVRRGLLNSTMQSEHVRGERRVTYCIYQITHAGLEALEKTDDR